MNVNLSVVGRALCDTYRPKVSEALVTVQGSDKALMASSDVRVDPSQVTEQVSDERGRGVIAPAVPKVELVAILEDQELLPTRHSRRPLDGNEARELSVRLPSFLG